MRHALSVVIAVLGLSVSRPLAQTDDPPNCPHIEDAPQTLIDRLSTLIAYDGNTGNYSYLGTKVVIDAQIDFSMSIDNDFIIDGPALSSDGTKLMGTFGSTGRARVSSVVVLNLTNGSARKYALDLDYPDRSRFEASWVDNNTIAVSVLFHPENLYSITLLDVNTGLSTVLDLTGIERNTPVKSLAKLSPNLIHLLYTGFPGGSRESLLNFDLQTQQQRTIYTIFFTSIRSFSWSPTGEYIIVEENSAVADYYPQKVTILHPSGEVIADLHSYLNPYSYTNATYVWSPDGRKLAFQNGDPEITIQILNMEDLTIVDTCFLGEPFWSADGNFLAITQQAAFTESPLAMSADVFVYDLIGEALYRTSEYDTSVLGRILGWAILPSQ